MTWTNANKRCSRLTPGAHLAAVMNEDQDTAIVKYLKSLNYSEPDLKQCILIYQNFPKVCLVYTSGQRLNPRNCNSTFAWKLADGEPIELTYTNWPNGEPNCASNNEACLVYDTYDYTTADRRWNDVICNGLYCSLCEASPIDEAEFD